MDLTDVRADGEGHSLRAADSQASMSKKYLFMDNVIFRGKKSSAHVSHFSVISQMRWGCVEMLVFRKELAGDNVPWRLT